MSTSSDFNQPLLLAVPKAYLLWLVALIMTALALCVLFWVGLSWVYKLIIVFLIFIYLFIEIKGYLKQQVTHIKRDTRGHWMLQTKANEWLPARLNNHHVISQRLIIIHLTAGKRRYSLWLFKHQIRPDTFRRLSVFLRLHTSQEQNN